MTVDSIQAEPTANPAVQVRLCAHCSRPLPALHKDEYTPARARIVAATGFCVCPGVGETAIPDHAPSLL